MNYFRRIVNAVWKKESVESSVPKIPRVYVCPCGWGELKEFNEKGEGYIRFDNGGGQIVRNWDHFMNLVSQIETDT